MELRLHIPDQVAAALQRQWPDGELPRHALEDLVIRWYQEDRLTEEEVRQSLGLATRPQVYDLLKRRGVPSRYTVGDFDADLAAQEPRPRL